MSFEDQIRYYFSLDSDFPLESSLNDKELELFRSDYARFKGHDLSPQQFIESLERSFIFINGNLSHMIKSPRRGIHVSLPFVLEQSLQRPDITFVDARFPKEFEKGHISGALNFHKYWDSPELRQMFWTSSFEPKFNNQILILYCDFSLYRAVELYRSICRVPLTNEKYVPYAEIYIMHGGFHGLLSHIKQANDQNLFQSLEPSVSSFSELFGLFLPEVGKSNIWRQITAPSQLVFTKKKRPTPIPTVRSICPNSPAPSSKPPKKSKQPKPTPSFFFEHEEEPDLSVPAIYDTFMEDFDAANIEQQMSKILIRMSIQKAIN